MARKKTTIYLESDLLNATKALAASSGRREYEVVELWAYMRSEEVEQARKELKDLLDRVAERSTLTDEEAMAIAYEELHAARAEQ
jgi:hypothetical protein